MRSGCNPSWTVSSVDAAAWPMSLSSVSEVIRTKLPGVYSVNFARTECTNDEIKQNQLLG